MSRAQEFRIAAATPADVPVILEMITALAEYERLSDQVVATEAALRDTLFGAHPAAEVVIGYAGDTPAGFALFFHTYSTFLAQRGLYLEDLFVAPPWRGRGLGRQLLSHLARIAVERKCGRMEWSVLNWNQPAIRVYRGVGAAPMDEWTVYRLTGTALRDLAGS
jgi:GNAT superfamily N-acetyltransferase